MNHRKRQLFDKIWRRWKTLRAETDYLNLLPPNYASPLPIPYFGQIERAQIITLGVNPSAKEFTSARRKAHWGDVDGSASLLAAIENYFSNENRNQHQWFDGWEKGLAHLNASYKQGKGRFLAAHVDLLPWPTAAVSKLPSVTRVGGHPPRATFLGLLLKDQRFLVQTLKLAMKARVLLMAGSVGPFGQIDDFIGAASLEADFQYRAGRQQQTKSGMTLRRGELYIRGRAIRTWFFSQSPSHWAGPGNLGGAIREFKREIAVELA